MAENKAGFLTRIRNGLGVINPFLGGLPSPVYKEPTYKNLNTNISPVQLQRLRHDVQMWREAIVEAENAWYPHRVRMQRLFIDTQLNGHVAACMERRKDLTLLRDFCVYNDDDTENEDVTRMLQSKWFHDIINYSLDALFYGYSLVGLGDIEDGKFKDINLVRRWNISPDRLNVTRLVYSLSGFNFLEDPYKDWHIWVKTPTETGQSPCGYGLLYKVAIYEIFMRNILGYNGDFVELFAQPYRVGKTLKTEENERNELAKALQDMGSAGWAIIDNMDSIEFLESSLGGNGYKGYADLEMRCTKMISKVLLGHADALDSVPGKLGSSNGEENPVYQALEDKQTKDGRFIEELVNDQIIPKLRVLGFPIPEGVHFCFSNDAETEEVKLKERENGKAFADIALTLKNAGLKMDEKYFTEMTGIPVTDMPIPAPMPNLAISDKIKAKLDKIYK